MFQVCNAAPPSSFLPPKRGKDASRGANNAPSLTLIPSPANAGEGGEPRRACARISYLRRCARSTFTLNVFDVILLLVLVLFTSIGTWRGFVRELVSFITWIVAGMAAWMLSGPLAPLFERFA